MWGKGNTRLVVVARQLPISLLETMLAKEAKTVAQFVVENT